MYIRYRSVVYVDVGEHFYQAQEYVAWCLRDEFGNIGMPLRTFDVPIDLDGIMAPHMADGEVIDPTPMDESVEMEVEPEPEIQQEDPPLEEEMDAPDVMVPDNEEEGDVEEPSSEEDQGWFVDPELELDSDEEALAALDAQGIDGAQAMDLEESEPSESSSEASSAESSDTSDSDWAP